VKIFRLFFVGVGVSGVGLLHYLYFPRKNKYLFLSQGSNLAPISLRGDLA